MNKVVGPGPSIEWPMRSRRRRRGGGVEYLSVVTVLAW